MTRERAPSARTLTVERRPIAAALRSGALSPRAVRPVVSRSARSPAAVAVTSPVSLQAARVSHPNDPAEREAVHVARKVVQLSDSAVAKPPTVRSDDEDKKRHVQRAARAGAAPVVKAEEEQHGKPIVHRAAAPAIAKPDDETKNTIHRAAATRVGPDVAAIGGGGGGGGAPLPVSVRSYMEPRFDADFGNVRIHTGLRAAERNVSLNAHAFTIGNHIHFGQSQFRPDTGGGRELIAHELTHTIQQGGAIQRSAAPTVTTRSEPQIQRFGLSDALDYIADKANYIPGFRLLTVVLGVNPVNMAPAQRNAANILRGLLELIPVTGALIAQALAQYGIFDKVGAWIEGKLAALGVVGSALKGALGKFLDSLSWTDVLHPGDVWDRGKRIFTEPIDRLIALGKSLVTEILSFIRQAILLPLARLAEGTRGYDLLKAVLGEDPVTGDKVAPTPEAFLGGFLKLVGQEEIWNNMQKAKALPRAWAWFQGAIGALKGFVGQIPGLFVTALKSLGIADLVNPIGAFGKLAAVFGNFIGQFVNWGLNAAWTLLELIFDVVSPGAFGYIKRTGAAMRSILKNPLPFVGNLVKAAKLGFMGFAGNFLDHLKAGLIDWLTGSLPGIYIPKAFSLVEIAKFAFSVLGLTWANIRGKLVKAIGETAVKALETGFDIVVTLIRDGPAAAWDLIKEQLANLKDMVIGGITDFIVDMVVKKAIPKLVAMFIPGAGFISAILSIYDTVMVFVNKISQIIQVVTNFIDSIVAIAAGQIAPAAKRVESILAGLLSLAINFLAGFAGLGKVADKIMGVIAKIRAPIDKALDWLINWIVTMAKKLFAKAMGRDNETPQEKQKRLDKAAADALSAVNKYTGKPVGALILKPILAYIKIRHGLTAIEPIPKGDTWSIRLEINPVTIVNTSAKVGKKNFVLTFTHEPQWPLDEFESKCNAMKRAAEKKKMRDVVPPDLKTVGTGKTKALRKGGQAAFREDIKLFIAAVLSTMAAPQALSLMTQLQADHQQELQVGGTDTPENMALIESSMNASLGSQLKNAIKDAKVDADTVISEVKVAAPKGKARKAVPRSTGTAIQLQNLLLDAKNHTSGKVPATTKARILLWFKLD